MIFRLLSDQARQREPPPKYKRKKMCTYSCIRSWKSRVVNGFLVRFWLHYYIY